jgi:hypothetical protein
MPAVHADLFVEAGSYEPIYWMITDPNTGDPLDLTLPGFTVHGVVATRPDGTGIKLLDLPDSSVWSRTSTGRVYFQPPSAISDVWPLVSGYYQAKLSHPSGQEVRFSQGRFIVSYDIVH